MSSIPNCDFSNNDVSPPHDADTTFCLQCRNDYRLRLKPSAIRLVLHGCMVISATCAWGPNMPIPTNTNLQPISLSILYLLCAIDLAYKVTCRSLCIGV
jgi:hypothetical protein